MIRPWALTYFNIARLMHRYTQPKRTRFVIGNHAHKKEGPRTRYSAAQKGTATGDGFGGVAGWSNHQQGALAGWPTFRSGCLRSRSHETAIILVFHNVELRGTLPVTMVCS